MDISEEDRRRAFVHYLRTGRLLRFQADDSREFKFNPYHDPRNGRFTFAPGGPQSLRHVVVSDRRRPRVADSPSAPARQVNSEVSQESRLNEAVYRPDEGVAILQPAGLGPGSRLGRGGNIRAFQDPMTLEQTFPGLRDAPGGAIVALADSILDFTGPRRDLTAELTRIQSNVIVSQIQAIDPQYRPASLNFPQTLEGQANQLIGLRFDRAVAFFREKNEIRPLQVETLRTLQRKADEAYNKGVRLLGSGKLNILLSEREALGNYIDREVRREMREWYNSYGIASGGQGPVRVNRRENITSGSDITYRRPDARVGGVAFDVTLSEKTLRSPQIQGFFRADFRPSVVVIVRPRQTGSTYIIVRPETKAMSEFFISPYRNPNPYVPQALSEIWDLLGSMYLHAPMFLDKTGDFPERNIDSEFHILVESFGVVRKKLGEERYARLIDLVARAKALFAADPEDKTGDTDAGRKLLTEIEDIIQEVRSRRVAAKMKDDEGEVSGD